MAVHSASIGPASVATPLWLRAAPVLFLLLWSGGFVLAKFGLAYAPPLTFLAIRYWFVIVVLLAVLIVVRPPVPRRASEWGHLIVVGALVQGLYFSLCHVGYWLGVSTGTMALIVSLQPIMVGLLAPQFVAERVGLIRWVGLVLGLVGAGIVIVARSEVAVTSGLGLLCAAGALLTITAGTLYEKRFGLNHHPVTANAVQYLVGFVLILAFALSLEDMEVRWTAEFALTLVYLVIGNSLVAVTLLLAMIRHGEAARVSALLFLVPPTVALIAWVVLGETMPPAAWAGMAVAAAGVALATRRLPVKQPAITKV
jgi:drug/metabolite transporter (DMT)-like permease